MTNSEQPAFPNMNYEGIQMGGLTKREYFAAMAMQGLFADMTKQDEYTFQDVALDAVQAADALLAELEKGKG